MVGGEVKDLGFPAKETFLVGVEGAWPVLFRVTGSLGFHLAKRRPSGHYEVSWIRIVSMMIIVVALSFHMLTYSHDFTDVAYDVFTDILCYTTNSLRIFFAFALAVHRRRELCILLQALEGHLKPPRIWFSVAGSILFLLFVALFLALNYDMAGPVDEAAYYWICLTLILPVLPSLLDLYLASLIHALAKVYQRNVLQLQRQGRVNHRTLSDQQGKVFPAVENSWKEIPSLLDNRFPIKSDVTSIVNRCKEMSALVTLFNQIFSYLLAFTCCAFLFNIMNAVYYIAISFNGRVPATLGSMYAVFITAFFYLTCLQADSLTEYHKQLEDVVHDLQQDPDTTTENRSRLLSLSGHLQRRPAHIAIGNVGVLGTHVLVFLLNVGLTYSAILYQYRPGL